MERAELNRERARVRWRLTFDNNPPEWLLGRLDSIEEMLKCLIRLK